MFFPTRLLPLLFAVALAACSSQAWYDNLQRGRVHECERLQGAAREECLAEVDTTYEEYRNQREELQRAKAEKEKALQEQADQEAQKEAEERSEPEY